MENKEFLEGKKTDTLEATSASDQLVEENEGLTEDMFAEELGSEIPNLSTNPVPTEQEIADASISPAEEPAPLDDVAPVSDQPIESEPVATEEPALDNAALDEAPVDEAPVPVEQNRCVEENGVTDLGNATRTFTQSQVNDMMGGCRTETREKTFRYIYDRYGVNSEAELDDLIGNAQRYDSLKEEYDTAMKTNKEVSTARDAELASIKEQVALMQSGIDSAKYDDAKAILKYKGLEINTDNIQAELANHPEWKKVAEAEKPNPNFAKTGEPTINPQPTEPASKISVLGNDTTPKGNPNEEEDYVLGRMFKV